MKTPLKTSLGLLLGLAILAGPAVAGDQREWSVTRGANIKAEFVELKGDKVVLRSEDGDLTEIPLMQLSGSDQSYARKMAMSKPAGKGGAASGPVKTLPTIAEGPWKGVYAYYEGPKMDVTINSNGFATIYLKDKGQRIGPAVPMGWGIRYSDGGQVAKSRLVEYFEDVAPPGPIKGRLECKGMAEDKTKFEEEFVVVNNALEMGIEFREPANISYKGGMKYGLSIPAARSFPETATLDEMIKGLVGYTLSFEQIKGGRVDLKFHEVATLTNTIESATIKGPWGPRVLTVSQRRGSPIYITNYASTQVWRGFNIRKYLTSGLKTAPMRVAAE